MAIADFFDVNELLFDIGSEYLSLCKNWRGICLLDISSKILSSVLVARMGAHEEDWYGITSGLPLGSGNN